MTSGFKDYTRQEAVPDLPDLQIALLRARYLVLCFPFFRWIFPAYNGQMTRIADDAKRTDPEQIVNTHNHLSQHETHRLAS